MPIKTQKTIVNVMAVMAVLLMLSISSGWDAEDAQAAANQAQYVKTLAQQEADERKSEFNRLAFEGERMNGLAGDIK
jgi:type II secretory pathway component PulK